MGLEITILNEVRKRKINTIYVIIYMWNLKYDTIRDFSGGPVVETLCFY